MLEFMENAIILSHFVSTKSDAQSFLDSVAVVKAEMSGLNFAYPWDNSLIANIDPLGYQQSREKFDLLSSIGKTLRVTKFKDYYQMNLFFKNTVSALNRTVTIENFLRDINGTKTKFAIYALNDLDIDPLMEIEAENSIEWLLKRETYEHLICLYASWIPEGTSMSITLQTKF